MAAVLLVLGGLWLSTRWYGSAVAMGRVVLGVTDGGISFSVFNPKIVPLNWGIQVVRNPLPLRMQWKPVFRRNPSSTIVWVPMAWPVGMTVGMMVITGWRRWRGGARRGSGACSRCGYDLRGLPEDRSCPECGATRGELGGPS